MWQILGGEKNAKSLDVIIRGCNGFSLGDVIAYNLPDCLQDFTLFTWPVGWRKSEISGLLWSENTDWESKMIRIFQSKNGDGRILPLMGELYVLVQRRWKVKNGDYIFHRDGRPLGDFRRAGIQAVQRRVYLVDYSTIVVAAPLEMRLSQDFRNVIRWLFVDIVPTICFIGTTLWWNKTSDRRC